MFNRPTLRARLLVGATVAGLITSAGAITAQASERGSDSASIAVTTHDLDLRTQAGTIVLRHRVLAAANEVCRRVNADEAPNSEAVGICVEEAVHGASRQVHKVIAAAQATLQLASVEAPAR